MAAVMMAGVLTMTAAAWIYSIAVTLARARRIILERERKTAWVQKILAQEA
jgi:heme exporter protein C